MQKEGKKKIRLAVLVSHPIQYFVPLYKVISQRDDIKLTVIYHCKAGVEAYYDVDFGQNIKWDVSLLEGYRSQFLSKKPVALKLDFRIIKALMFKKYDSLIVHGYASATHVLAIILAKLMGVQVLLRGDTRLDKRHKQSAFWKLLFKRIIFKFVDGFLTIGSLNELYYLSFGVAQKRIYFAPFSVNNSTFALNVNERLDKRLSFRKKIGIPKDATVILFASKLIKQKRAIDLIQAFFKLYSNYPNAWVVIAGSGCEEPLLRHTCESMKLRRVLFLGFQNQSELARLYAVADCFVFPSAAEAWGLSLNEVMAAGLPVIVSDEVGAAPDLVLNKGCGFVYPCGDVNALSRAIGTLLSSKILREKMGSRAKEIIRKWDIKHSATSMVSALKELRCSR